MVGRADMSRPSSLTVNERKKCLGSVSSLEAWVERVRTELPPARAGPQAAEKWRAANRTTHELRSGVGDIWFRAAALFARETGMVRGQTVLGLAGHIEIKFPMCMRAEKIRDARIVIDRSAERRPPASGPVRPSCHGSCHPRTRLTVVERNGNRWTHTGDEDS